MRTGVPRRPDGRTAIADVLAAYSFFFDSGDFEALDESMASALAARYLSALGGAGPGCLGQRPEGVGEAFLLVFGELGAEEVVQDVDQLDEGVGVGTCLPDPIKRNRCAHRPQG